MVRPLFFPGGDIGKLAVHGTVNDLAVGGAEPLFLTAAFILEEGLALAELERIVASMREACDLAGVTLVAGDTKVVDRGKGDKVFIVTTGVGLVPEGRSLSISAARPGDRIVVSGTIGDHGIAIMSVREGIEFETVLESDTAPLSGLVRIMLEACPGIRAMRDPTRGGCSSALNELASSSKVGVVLDEPAIPIKPEVRGACEMLGLDPLYVANEGKLIAVVPPADVQRVVAVMRSHPLGRDAAQIGEVVAEHPGMVTLRSSIGGERRGHDAGGRTVAEDLLMSILAGVQEPDPGLEEDAQQAAEPAPKKRSGQILRHELREALTVLERKPAPLFVSGLSAGLDLGFSLFLMAVMLSKVEGELPRPIVDLLVANMYSVGFIFVVLGRSELFTEQTTLAVLPVLSGQASVGALLRLWGIVYAANMIGATIFAGLATLIGPALGVIEPRNFGVIARHLTGHSGIVIFQSAVLAGWLMGLLSWLVSAGRDTISQIVLVWLITTSIGFANLHHVVLGTVEVLAGAFSGQGVGPWDVGRFLVCATLGNILGGSFFVALIKYGHARQEEQFGKDTIILP